MTFYSDYPISVDGVRLDTLAYGVEAVKWEIGGLRGADAVVPGMSGVVPTLNKDREQAAYTLSMFVRGTDVDGVADDDSVGMMRENLDSLLHLFGQTDHLLDVREVVDALGTERQALCQVLDSMEPELSTETAAARFTVTLTVPSGTWQDPEPVDMFTGSGVTSGWAYTLLELRGATAPIPDARFVVTGPATNPQIEDPATGQYVRLNRALTASDRWLYDAGAWVSRVGTSLTLDSPLTAGADATADTVWTSDGRPLTLTPTLPDRAVQVRPGGSAFGVETSLYVRARRRFL